MKCVFGSLRFLVDMRDVWMIECRRGHGFLHEAPHSIPVSGHRRRQDLQGYFAMQPQVLRQINFTHPSFAEQRANLIMVETGIRNQ